jgi:hypothetical protein
MMSDWAGKINAAHQRFHAWMGRKFGRGAVLRKEQWILKATFKHYHQKTWSEMDHKTRAERRWLPTSQVSLSAFKQHVADGIILRALVQIER